MVHRNVPSRVLLEPVVAAAFRRVLARRGVRFHPVPPAHHPQQLIIGGAAEAVIRPGRRIGEPGQLRAARHHVEQHPGRELRRRPGVPAREDLRGAGLARAPPAGSGTRPGGILVPPGVPRSRP
ncbi:MAG: hypothetical protein ACRDOH_27730 [Streptosporangiaceae bacterium]